MRTVRCWYGSVQIPRIFCSRCKTWSFVLDGIRQCCEYETTMQVVKHRRMTIANNVRRQPPKALRDKLLEQFQHRCAYCERLIGSWVRYHGRSLKLTLEWDHELPFAYINANPDDNFLPACRPCNRWKYSKVFQTLEEVQVYVATRWEKEAEKRSQQKVRMVRKLI